MEPLCNMFGVCENNVNGSTNYVLIDKDADWIRNYGQEGLHTNGNRVTIDGKQLAFSIMSYWQSKFLSLGKKVLENLKGSLQYSKSNGSVFHQGASLFYMFDLSKFLLDCEYLNVTISEDLVPLRLVHLENRLLEEIILHYVDTKEDLTYWTIRRVTMICLGPRLPIAHYEHIIKKLQRNPRWKLCVEIIKKDGLQYIYAATAVQRCLEDTFMTNWKCANYISPHSFVYLLDRFLLILSFSSEVVYTTKSSFVGLLPHIHSRGTLTLSSGPSFCNVGFVVATIQEILDNKEDTISWIQRSKIDRSYYPLLVLNLVTLLSIICMKVDHAEFLLDLLSGRNNISCLLSKKFVGDILRKKEDKKLNLNIEVVAEALLSINDPLVIVSSANVTPKIAATCALFVDLRKSEDEILSILFPRKNNTLPDANMNMNPVELQMNGKVLDKISKAINGKKGVALSKLSSATIIKEEVDKTIGTLDTILVDQKLWSDKDARVIRVAYDTFGVLSETFDKSRQEVEHSVLLKHVRVAVKELQITRPKIDKLLNHYVMSHTSNVEEPGDEELVVLENQSQSDNTQDGNKKKGKGNNKGKKSSKSKVHCLLVAMSDKHAGRDEAFLGMKMVGSGMLMVVVVVAVVGEIEVVTQNLMLAVDWEYTDCRNMLTLELLHSLVPPAKVSVFTILLAKKESDLETSAAYREILLPDLSVDVALKSKHEENKAYLYERPLSKHTMKSKLLKDLTESDRIVGELLQLEGYLKLIEFGLNECVDVIEA
ncbi:hypothetical protein Tco_1344461 [Tanacetum coccineum]